MKEGEKVRTKKKTHLRREIENDEAEDVNLIDDVNIVDWIFVFVLL